MDHLNVLSWGSLMKSVLISWLVNFSCQQNILAGIFFFPGGGNKARCAYLSETLASQGLNHEISPPPPRLGRCYGPLVLMGWICFSLAEIIESRNPAVLQASSSPWLAKPSAGSTLPPHLAQGEMHNGFRQCRTSGTSALDFGSDMPSPSPKVPACIIDPEG